MDVMTALQFAVPVATIAAAWGGTRAALNGTRERVKSIDTKLDASMLENNKQHQEIMQRVTVVETKLRGK